MDFRQIEAFVNVIKYKSFSKAADASFLTQPTVSTHVSTLERELGIKLIDRQGKEALPTRQGRILYKYAINLLNTRERAIFALQSYTNDIDGVLEIQASSVPGEYMVPSLMAKFNETFPLVKFYLEQSDSKRVEENLLEHKGELGFIGNRRQNNLHYEQLITDHMVLITPMNSQFSALVGQKLKIEDLINLPFVWREQGSATRMEFEEKIGELGFDSKKMNVVARVNSSEAIKQAVSDGLGVSIISQIAVARDHNQRRFLTFEIDNLHLDRAFFMAWNKNTALSPTAEAFKEFVLESYR
jgi:DNA-binding transcriptional LysR family regulator